MKRQIQNQMKKRSLGWAAAVILVLSFGCDGIENAAITGAGKLTGVGSSGGGIGVECTLAGRSVLKTLDIYEAETVHGLTLAPSTGSFEGDVAQYGRRLFDYFNSDPARSDAENLAEIQKFIQEKFSDVPEGSLSLTQDATLPAIPNHCRFVQIAIYDDVLDQVHLDRARFERLDSLNQVALVFHEGLYKLAREFKAKTSDDTRRILGLVFSSTPPTPYWGPYIGKQVLLCVAAMDRDQVSNFFIGANDIDENGVAGLRIFTSIVDGHFLLSRTSAFIPGLSVQGAVDESGVHLGERTIQASQDYMNRSWTMEIRSSSSSEPQSNPFAIQFRSKQGTLATPGVPDGAYTQLFCGLGTVGSK